ncbi:unnamed protein product [Orchesella dallaii]|uniref:Histone-lysine N-methyltransferase PRDM9 n=1 Tax=Orchesella dallaii TaxID=48710 RepID=A0ABP1R9I4_9HEXA
MDNLLVSDWKQRVAKLIEKKSSNVEFNNAHLLTRDTSMLDQVICDCDVGSCRPNSCSNALSQIQCSEKCGCRNNWFKSVDSAKCLETFLPGPPELGIGIRASMDIKQGEIVGEYVGELLSKEDYEHLQRTTYSSEKHFYAMTIQRKESNNGRTIPEAVLDATTHANRTKWINHCKVRPNLKVEIWRVMGLPRVYFRSLFKLPKGTELTYDYGMDNWNPEVCLCSNCTPNGNAEPFIPIPDHISKRKRKGEKNEDKPARKSARIEGQRPLPPVSVCVQTDEVVEDVPEPEAVEARIAVAPKTYLCEVCNKVFNHKSNIKRHKLIHSRENQPPIECVTCKSTFSEKYSLKKHIKSVHAELYEKIERDERKRKAHVCNLCSARFTTKRSLVYHEKTKHK